MKDPLIPVSIGELIDKITILEIKVSRLNSEISRSNAKKELYLLSEIFSQVNYNITIDILKAELLDINTKIWMIEDAIREKEHKKEFDVEFIELARSVYKNNDKRAAIKRKINLQLNSNLIEEKGYAAYD